MSTTHKWRPGLFYIIAGMALILPERAMAVCFGDSEVVSEYLFSEGSGTTVINTGIDEDDGNAASIWKEPVPPRPTTLTAPPTACCSRNPPWKPTSTPLTTPDG